MVKSLFIIVLLTLFAFTSLDAAIYKGQMVFMQQCIGCHTDCQSFVAKHTKAEWEDFTKEKGKPLADLHLKSSRAKNSQKYFQSPKYTKKLKHLREFLVEYAKDSENVPACN